MADTSVQPPAFAPLPPERFAAFHRRFRIDTWDSCALCGGKCEINKIGSLMPGEAEYIAASREQGVESFRHRFLDGVETPFGPVDVLKLKVGCPFLSPDFHCTIEDVKVVLCEIYPVAFELDGEAVRFTLDEWCPIVRSRPSLAQRFEHEAIPALRELDAPESWYRAVQLYDHLCVDYRRLEALRAGEMGYRTFSLAELERCLTDEPPPPELPSDTVALGGRSTR